MIVKTSLSFFIFASVFLTSCSGQGKDDAVTYDVTADVTKTAPVTTTSKNGHRKTALIDDTKIDTDSEPYKLGREHAVKLSSSCTSTEEIRDELLDINARANNIRNRINKQAANNYLAGIRDYLTENSDTLANTLF